MKNFHEYPRYRIIYEVLALLGLPEAISKKRNQQTSLRTQF